MRTVVGVNWVAKEVIREQWKKSMEDLNPTMY